MSCPQSWAPDSGEKIRTSVRHQNLRHPAVCAPVKADGSGKHAAGARPTAGAGAAGPGISRGATDLSATRMPNRKKAELRSAPALSGGGQERVNSSHGRGERRGVGRGELLRRGAGDERFLSAGSSNLRKSAPSHARSRSELLLTPPPRDAAVNTPRNPVPFLRAVLSGACPISACAPTSAGHHCLTSPDPALSLREQLF